MTGFGAPSAARAIARGLRRVLPGESLVLAFVLAALTMIYYRLNPTLASVNGIHSAATQFAPLILVAMAQALIMIVVGIDLSIGAHVSLSMCIFAVLSTGSPTGDILAFAVVLATGMLINLGVGSLVTFFRLPAIIVTLGTSYAIGGLALTILPVPGGHVPSWYMNWYQSNILGFLPAPLAVILAALALWKMFKSTPLGLGVYATGDNEAGAYASGVPVVKARLAAYIAAGFLTALAGLIIAAQVGSGDPVLGRPYTLNSIAAAVLGGVSFLGGEGRMRSVVLGALILGFLFNVLFFSGISPFYQYVIQGLALIAAVGIKALPETSWVRRLRHAARARA